MINCRSECSYYELSRMVARIRQRIDQKKGYLEFERQKHRIQCDFECKAPANALQWETRFLVQSPSFSVFQFEKMTNGRVSGLAKIEETIRKNRKRVLRKFTCRGSNRSSESLVVTEIRLQCFFSMESISRLLISGYLNLFSGADKIKPSLFTPLKPQASLEISLTKFRTHLSLFNSHSFYSSSMI